MWDWLKETAGKLWNAGIQYATHYAFVAQTVKLPDSDAIERLRNRVNELDDSDYAAFRETINFMISEAENSVKQLEDQALNSWGGFIEDRIAYLGAHLNAGSSPYETPEVQQARAYLERLQGAGYYADQFRQQLLSRKKAEQTAYSTESEEPDAATRISQRMEAFTKHANSIFGTFLKQNEDDAADDDAEDDATASREPMTSLEAMQLFVKTDSRVTGLMVRVMPQSVSEEIVNEFLDAARDYERVLAVEPLGGVYTQNDVRSKIGMCFDFAGRAKELLRDYQAAIGHYKEAVCWFEGAGNTAEAKRISEAVRRIEIYNSGDVDAEMAAEKQKLLEDSSDSLMNAGTWVNLGEAHLRNYDDQGALECFRQAEEMLERLGMKNPGSENLAIALISSIKSIQGGARAGATTIEEQIKVRQLYQRIYDGFATACETIDPDESARYAKLAENMDSRQASQEFGQHVQNLFNPKDFGA